MVNFHLLHATTHHTNSETANFWFVPSSSQIHYVLFSCMENVDTKAMNGGGWREWEREKQWNSRGQQQVKETISFSFPVSKLERHRRVLGETIGFMLITYEINMLKHSRVRRKRCHKTRIGWERIKEVQQAHAHSEVAGNVQAFTHWTNIFHFISMTKNTIILDMPECRFH